ncbi:MAG: HAD family hydrolase [archaeon]
MKIKLIIFDFDGTIVDSKAIYYNSFKKNIANISIKEIDKIINKGHTLSGLLSELRFSWIGKWIIKRKIMGDVFKNLDKVKKCRDAGSIKEIKVRRILVTNSSLDYTRPLIKRLKLKKYFKEVYGADNFDSKEDFIGEYIKKRKLKKQEVMYVGDRVTDVELAKNLGIIGVAVAGKCAWNSRKELLQAGPDFIVEDIKEINKLIKQDL